MESDLKKDIIDGRIIDWSKLSTEEIKRMKKAYEERENKIRMKIDKELDLEEICLSSGMIREDAHRFYERHGYIKDHYSFEKKL